MSAPNFIGLGVEKSGTSWIFACLYEHPEICIPVKEVNFFSNEEKWRKGNLEYERFFNSRCSSEKVRGEFSTAYFYNEKVATRIHSSYPDTKLIVCLRNPIDRAYSNYLNDIKAGTIKSDLSFEAAMKINNYYIDQGRYKEQFERYFSFFKKEQIKILIYEDLVANPLTFIQSIYNFLEVDTYFIPAALHQKINTGRIPSNVGVEKLSNRIASLLQSSKAGEKIWWLIKKSRLPEILRSVNTQAKKETGYNAKTREKLKNIFRKEQNYVEQLLSRKLGWFE